MKSPNRVILAAALTLATSACAGAGANVRSMAVAGSIRVGVQFDGACPTEVDVTATPCKGAKRCLEVVMEKGKAKPVHFEAVQTNASAGDLDLSFSLDFDPFHKGNNPFKGKKGQLLQLELDPATPRKAYTYNVYAPGCPVLDPQIIVRDP
jgi:hypothetical protein